MTRSEKRISQKKSRNQEINFPTDPAVVVGLLSYHAVKFLVQSD